MHHTLSLNELKELISVLCHNTKSFDDELRYIENFYNDSVSWDRKLISLNHLLSRVIEQFEKKGIDTTTILNFIYNLQKQCYFEIQEGDIRFIKSLFNNDCGSSLTLEEELLIAQNRIEK
ncbi:hypothetical protein NQT66_05675 [Cellulophaga baltica]|uniref:hypothetical protein n=1 Tax=Cellulophaga baltica TaxID=76594 RepID=UPI0021489BE2|nr:hypothetical protein [Cellulophaga baltica]MCR1024287.1 hypothetical protein [Cellulophaga baltica]